MNSVPVLLLIHNLFGIIITSPIPAQYLKPLTNNGENLLKDKINAEINSTLSIVQTSLKNIFEKDYEIDIWKNALTSTTAFLFTLLFVLVTFLRKKINKKLIQLEDKIEKTELKLEKTELKLKRKLWYLKTILEPSQQSCLNVLKTN